MVCKIAYGTVNNSAGSAEKAVRRKEKRGRASRLGRRRVPDVGRRKIEWNNEQMLRPDFRPVPVYERRQYVLTRYIRLPEKSPDKAICAVRLVRMREEMTEIFRKCIHQRSLFMVRITGKPDHISPLPDADHVETFSIV